MSRIVKTTCLLLGAGLMTACASHDHQDRLLLGAATDANIAVQSVRDVSVPNSKAVTSSSGVRAVTSVKALNEGKTKDLPTVDSSIAGDS